ncbi:sugar phosphate nucleotidyltransferase [Candidatus Eisenbacteria bacterium]|uniref:Sugar phosphate nucleotidyltransferase n=1 Tax=Eiseniibacteriota bacterium TaxID=2212470 RepID=A0ABV6YIK2_UNCEI
MYEADVLLLAAGFGSRLRPLTLRIPKALLPIYGIPLLDYHLARLFEPGPAHDGQDHPRVPLPAPMARRVVVNGHHLADMVSQHLDRHPFGERTVFSFEEQILGTGGAIRQAAAFLETDPFVVLNADILFPAPVEAAIAAHMDSGHLITMILTPSPLNPNVVVRDGRIVDILRDRTSPTAMTYTGCQVVSRRTLGLLPSDGFHDIRDTYRALIQEQLLGVYICPPDKALLDVGTPACYLKTHEQCAGEGARRYDLRIDPQDRGGTTAEGYGYVDASARIGDGASIRESVILPRAWVGDGVCVERSIIGPDVRVDQTACNVLITLDGSLPIDATYPPATHQSGGQHES